MKSFLILFNFQKFIHFLPIWIICKDFCLCTKSNILIILLRQLYHHLVNISFSVKIKYYSKILHESTLILWQMWMDWKTLAYSVLLLPRLNKKYLYHHLAAIISIFSTVLFRKALKHPNLEIDPGKVNFLGGQLRNSAFR